MNTVDLEQQIASLSINVVTGAAILLVLLVIATVLLRDRIPKLKPYLFGMLAATLILPTLFFAGSTIYLNVKSDSKGPVHWHAEVEFWACDSELELRNPSAFLSNKIGTSTYHEHDDKHIHLEGVVVRKAEDASLGKFMRVTGGSLSSNAIDVPLNEDSAAWLTQGEKLDGDPAGSLSVNQLENSFIKHSQSGPVAHLRMARSVAPKQRSSRHLSTRLTKTKIPTHRRRSQNPKTTQLAKNPHWGHQQTALYLTLIHQKTAPINSVSSTVFVIRTAVKNLVSKNQPQIYVLLKKLMPVEAHCNG